MRFFFLAVFFFVGGMLIGQDLSGLRSKTITVTGSAEMSIIPDEIELEIVLREYNSSKMKTVSMAEIESRFAEILEVNSLSEEDVILEDAHLYWYYWWSRRRQQYKQKRLRLKLDKDADILRLVQDLDFEGVQSLRIANSTNSEIQKYRKEVKIQALQAAKDKAKYLLESIDESLGSVVTIEEISPSFQHSWYGGGDQLSNVVLNRGTTEGEIANVANIKLRYELKVIFEIL